MAIKIEGLGKSYVIRHEHGDRYLALRDVLTDAAKELRHRVLNPFAAREAQSTKEVFWALRDINLEIKEGERIGIIGRNGAGKSTMLKLLSRITEPTEGRIAIRGRVSSLLEVGTGFHAELTGRENIYLNGTILGMPSQEIRRKFDEIVAFAEVERFLDTPVKRYSSGMYVRLAFSVAAHLEPDILIVDEVLAVGDAQFQRRCLGRMEELSGSGRTVILVTHNMDAFVSLCGRGVVLDQGSIAIDSTAQQARAFYLKAVGNQLYSVQVNSGRGGSGGATILDVWVEDNARNKVQATTGKDAVTLCMAAELGNTFLNRDDLGFAFGIDTAEGQRLFTTVSSWTGDSLPVSSPNAVVACNLPWLPLVPGRYLVSASIIFHGDTLESIQHCSSFEVLPDSSGFHVNRSAGLGHLNLPCRFQIRSSPVRHVTSKAFE